MTARPGDIASMPPSPPKLRPIVFADSRRPRPDVAATAISTALLAPIAAILIAALLFGWKFQPIESGSMTPRLPVGSLAVVVPIDGAQVEAGMVIVFEDPQTRGRLVAHRAVERLPGSGPVWRTKGDANRDADPVPVPAHAVTGRVQWTIPVVGQFVTALRGPQAVVLLVGLPLAILAVGEVRRWRRKGAVH